MSQITKYAAVWQSRIGLGVIFVGAVVSGLWPDHARPLDPAKLVACVVFGTAWLAAEFASAETKPSNHDLALFERINSVMNDDALTFLVSHDFQYHTNTRSTEPVVEISYWHGPNSMFNDKSIQKRWKVLFAKSVALSNLYGDNLVNTDVEGRLTAWHIGFSRNDQPAQAYAEIKQLKDASGDLYKEFGEFTLYARARLAL
jgi:hypothetical protein